jgi:hypothetical protein
MNSLRKVVLVLLVVAALSVTVVGAAPVAAAAPEAEAPAVSCRGGACQITGNATGLLGALQLGANLALTQLPFETTAGGNTQATLDAKKDITLSLPIGQVTLTNARLQVAVGADGKIKRLNGSADMPFPTFGLLKDVSVVNPARANVGLDLGKNLPDVGVTLQPDRPYLFFNANSFMSVAGRTPAGTDPFSLSFTPGQQLTLVIDTVDPVAYLNGQVTLSLTDQIALLGGVLESTPLGPYVPDTLPLRERTQFGLAGKFSKNLAESRLTLRGGYVLDAGFLPAQLGVDAQLAGVVGELTLSRDGALINGVLKSAIEPDKIFDGSVRVETFVPFNEAAGPSYAGLDANVKVPAAKLGVGAGAKASAGKYELSGQLTTPFTPSDLKGRVSGTLPDVAGAVGPAMGQAAGAVGSAARTVGLKAGEAAGTMGTTAGRAGAAVGSTAGKAASLVGPAARNAGEFLSSYARLGRNLVVNAISAGRSGRSGNATAEAAGLDM